MPSNIATVVEVPGYGSGFLAATSTATGVDDAKVSEFETKPIGKSALQETLHVAARRPLSIPRNVFSLLCFSCKSRYFDVGLPGLEPGTSSLSEKRSNRLSYRP
jgi:hypothetical protein